MTKPGMLLGVGSTFENLGLGATLAAKSTTQVGDLLVVGAFGRRAGGLLTPSGWTKQAEVYIGGGVNQYAAVYTRQAPVAGVGPYVFNVNDDSGQRVGLILATFAGTGVGGIATAALPTSGSGNASVATTIEAPIFVLLSRVVAGAQSFSGLNSGVSLWGNGSRIGAYLAGRESHANDFSTSTLSDVYGAIAVGIVLDDATPASGRGYPRT